ncbi:MAG TPA: hypothetical protein VF223_12020, partial [Trebonia sp.]
GYLPQKSTLTDISYGWEICSTGGKPETFTLSKFTVNAPTRLTSGVVHHSPPDAGGARDPVSILAASDHLR